MQLSRTAVTRLYNSSGVELITHASVAVLQSLTLEQTEPPAELWFFVFCFFPIYAWLAMWAGLFHFIANGCYNSLLSFRAIVANKMPAWWLVCQNLWFVFITTEPRLCPTRAGGLRRGLKSIGFFFIIHLEPNQPHVCKCPLPFFCYSLNICI